jgi:maltooligosyltrehalose trehalohydrolase
MEIKLLTPVERIVPMEREQNGYWSVEIEGVRPGTRYMVRLDGKTERPDPASFYQPEGVHGQSEVIDLHFENHDDNWGGAALEDYIFYELHAGVFTAEGTFEAIIEKLDHIADLGATCLEIMPIGQFPGQRNWGYDGVYPFSVQNSYGGPQGFRRLTDSCHRKGISVTLDVVYNHFGPEGNYLRDFGPYFTGKYITPWGEAVNFDGKYNDEVRNFFIENALFWFCNYRVDALRLDAVHAIYDRSAVPFLAQLADRVHDLQEKSGRKLYLIAESDLNDSRLIRSRKVWGYGLDSQWSDDFHHSLHALLTGERQGYYRDFGKLADLTRSLCEGYLYSGQYSEFRKRSHGNSSADLPSDKFVVAGQNHDQVGNRMLGERLSTLVSFEAQKVSAAAVLLSPFLPLLFMGEEYGEVAPFLYFVSHSDPELRKAVRLGRREEFKDFLSEGEPPDPESGDTFSRSRLDWNKISEKRHLALFKFYQALIRLRREEPAFRNRDRKDMEIKALDEKGLMLVRRRSRRQELFCIYNFDSADHEMDTREIEFPESYRKILDSAETVWTGPGSLLPEKMNGERSLKISGSSIAIYSSCFDSKSGPCK